MSLRVKVRDMSSVSTPIWGSCAEVFGRLAGKWTIDRRIENHGSLEGVASFTPTATGWANYHEEGRLRLAHGYEGDVEQRYLYRQLGVGFAVYFRDEPLRLFHEIHLAPSEQAHLTGIAKHWCKSDLYVTRYDFMLGGKFVIRHRVRGPRKDYTTYTWYRRI